MRARLAAGGRPIALSVATDVPHKNLAVLLRALTLLAPEERPLLAFAGSGTDAGELPGLVGELDLGDDVRILGAVARDDLEALYAQAHVLVTATLYEGFGLPVLEAMSCGAAVLAVRRLSLPEVGGDAVAYTEPDTDSIAESLRALILDPVRRAALSNAGKERAKEFPWEASAQAHLETYRRAAAGVTV
jgi:glycosyltransferase involved in cell wall biosynthesis